jgi:hypothetical protein
MLGQPGLVLESPIIECFASDESNLSPASFSIRISASNEPDMISFTLPHIVSLGIHDNCKAIGILVGSLASGALAAGC